MVSCSRCGEAGEDGNANLNRVARPGKSQEEPPRKTTVDSSQGLEAAVRSRGSELGPLRSALALSLPRDMHSFSSLSALFLLLSSQTNNLSFSFSTLTSTTRAQGSAGPAPSTLERHPDGEGLARPLFVAQPGLGKCLPSLYP